ncbi:CDP-diacylglycerol--serine O-phosphatidyltransferase [Sandaracinus amylolyticus]|uniref:CDP-diacylglycerol--serine O-phosphatidyltransferase n=1 Tax=Sandaracinus amylolyticus TaxID=927083 RepID=A0A0F6YMP9_9BACT|nr:CDP-diacylglycerol--serine O-phosphatidyltransferase [Sandaracinus amylolyticus]AKF09520.1 CDP-diacylglycerol--serine O-phosphatidyltransferase [Sandaracinus amylolyticus]
MRFDLRKTLFILPNLFTLSSIFCGFYAIVACTTANGSGETSAEDFYRAALLIVFAMFFDVIDGRVARLTKTQSAFGVQIDSLADVVSFGIAPAILVYRWSLHTLGVGGLIASFAYVACGAIRLARFNVMATSPSGAPKKPGKYIMGLPIPGAAGALVSIIVANFAVTGSLQSAPEVMLGVVIALSFFMVSTVPFRSFKDIKLGWRSVIFVGLTIASSAVIAVTYHPSFALVWLIVGYVAIAVLEAVLEISRKAARLAGRRGSPAATVEPAEEKQRPSVP